jgi:hypothetical protein
MKTRLLFLAAFAATLVLFAGCEGDTVGEPSPTTDDPACLGEKADDPSCQTSPLISSDTTVSSPDTTPPDADPPEPVTTSVDYEGVYCPGAGCTLTKSTIGPDRWACGEPPDYPPPVAFTGTKTEYIPATCGLPEPTNP